MNLKRRVGIDHCNKKYGNKVETCTCQHCYEKQGNKLENMHLPTLLANLYLANGQLPSQLGATQISAKSIAFYPYFGFYVYFHSFHCQSRHKMLWILLRFVLHPGSYSLTRYSVDWLIMLASACFPPCFLTFYCSDQSLLPFEIYKF